MFRASGGAELERRDTSADVSGLDVSGQRVIRGYSIVFNRPSEDLGGFIEKVSPEAVQRTLREGLDVRALFNHDAGKVLGRTRSGTLRLANDGRGLSTTIDPPDPTDPANLLVSIRRGDISGMSFSFLTLEDSWDFKGDIPIRTLLDIQIREVSIVTFPAYPDTSVGLRSMKEAANGSPFLAGVVRRMTAAQRDHIARSVSEGVPKLRIVR